MSGKPDAARIVRFADARRSPWKNGGGETAEVAVHPPGAALDAFGWRVSLATVARDGPFSAFRGVDRTFAVLGGGAVTLTVGTGTPTRVDVDGGPLRFAGEAPCRCGLSGGPATALNVMTRRGSFDCAVARLDPARALPRAAGAVTLLVCAEGEVETAFGPLGPLDVLVLPAGAAAGVGPGRVPARASVVSIWPLARRWPMDGR